MQLYSVTQLLLNNILLQGWEYECYIVVSINLALIYSKYNVRYSILLISP